MEIDASGDPTNAPAAIDDESMAPMEVAAARMASEVGRLRKGLGGALKAAMAEGPEKAVDVCRLEAPRIAAESADAQIRVGRTSHRLRNPANRPEPWMESILTAYSEDAPGAGRPRTIELGPSRFGYAEPIYMQPLCLTCHGSEIAPQLGARIRASYPEDQAVDFRVGELRGMFWATLETASLEEDVGGSSPPIGTH